MPKFTLSQWVFVVLFQLAFGLTVFGLTRAYYLEAAAPAVAQTGAPTKGGATLPSGLGESQVINIDKLTEMAGTYFTNRQYKEAAEAYRRLVDITPANVEAYNDLGLSLNYLGQTQEALRVLVRGSNIDPDFQRIWLTLGFVRTQAGDAAGARAALERAVELGPENPIGLEAQGMLNKLK